MGWIADLLQEIPSAARYKAELEKLESEHGILKSEKSDLISQLDTANIKIRHLEKQLAQVHGQKLEKESEEIIKLLAQTTYRLNLQQIASHLGVHPTKAEHFLNKLWEDDYVVFADSYTSPRTYGLYPKGQEYAVKHGFV